MLSSIRNMNIARTTQSTQSAPTIDRLIQKVSFLSVSCNQTVTQAEVALATNPCSADDTGTCNSDLLLTLAHQISHHSSRLQFRHSKIHPLLATDVELNLQQHPLLDESTPISLTCTIIYLGFAADNSPNHVAINVEISQGNQACCSVRFTLLSEEAASQRQIGAANGALTNGLAIEVYA